jgi:uncharacterized repeat protein (TIGR02543 family)
MERSMKTGRRPDGRVEPLIEGRVSLFGNCHPRAITKAFFVCLCVAAAGFAAGCQAIGIDKDKFDDSTPLIKGFPLSAHNAVLFKESGTLRMSADLPLDIAAVTDISWSIAEGSDVITIEGSANGTNVTIAPIAEGVATLRAKLTPMEGYAFNADSEFVSECRVVVLDNFTLTEANMLFFAGEFAAQDAEIDLSTPQLSALTAVANITWSKSGAGVTLGPEIDGVSAAITAGSAASTATLKATLSAKNAVDGTSAPDFNGDGLFAQAAVVTEAVPTFTLDTISETMLNNGEGSAAYKSFDVTAHYPSELDVYQPLVVWSSSDEATAEVAARATNPIGGGNAHGTGTAKAASAPSISATLQVAGRSFGPVSTPLAIVAYVDPTRYVDRVEISGDPSTLKQTATSTEITARAKHNDGNPPDNTNIIWTQSGAGSVTINPVTSADSNARKITLTGGTPGAVTVKATAQGDATKFATFNVTVQPPVVSWVGSPSATFTYGGTPLNLEATTDISDKRITWSITQGASSAQLAAGGDDNKKLFSGAPNSPVKSATQVKVKAASTLNANAYQEHTITINPHLFNISFDVNEGSGTPGPQNNVAYGSATAITTSAVTRTGYTFAGWTEVKNGTTYITTANQLDNNTNAKTPDGSLTLYAKWTPITYLFQSLTANGQDNTTLSTKLTLQFNVDVPGLASADITLTPALPKGTLAALGSGKYELPVSEIPANNVSVTAALSKADRVFSPASRSVSVYIPAPNYSYTLNATGSAQNWSAPYNGVYKIELWGAQGGNGAPSGTGGKGGYTYGNIRLNKNDSIAFYVGKAGANRSGRNGGAGGWNGGGSGGAAYQNDLPGGGGGGGATDVRQNGAELSHRIMVAGGGGGGGGNGTVNTGPDAQTGGGGGGGNTPTACNGQNGKVKNYGSGSEGATQTTGYALGIGQNGRTATTGGGAGSEGNGGAGGGYWGGKSKTSLGQNTDAAGGGGSSYVNTTLFTTGVGGTQGNYNASGRAGDGQAKITWVSW